MNGTCQINLRLLPSANKAIRKFISQREDLKNHILGLFEVVDLDNVRVPDMRTEKETGERLASTCISNFPIKYRTRLHKVALARGCTMSALLNGAVIDYCKILRKQQRQKASETE